MSQLHATSSQDVVKTSPSLDKIPEDVQLAIIKFIQSWKKSEGTEQEREKGKRARDTALRAVALSCRNLLSIYQQELLFDVTLNFRSLFRFYLLLANNRDARRFVRSVTFARRDDDTLDAAEKDLEEDLNEVFEALTSQGVKIDEGSIPIECVVEEVYRFLSNIQTLVILVSEFNIPFQSKWASARLPPIPFLTHSLKKLWIPIWKDSKGNLKARNVVWILVFCTGLRSASLSCVFDQDDFKYLAGFSNYFSGLSKVSKLALGVDFAAEESTRKYWDAGVGEPWIGGNKKTEAIFHLLKVTKNLQCLEINNLASVSNEKSLIYSSCLPALQTSYLSLKSLRLFGLGINCVDPERYNSNSIFSLYQNLKVMSLDTAMLVLLGRISEIRFPPALKILYYPYYSSQAFQDDLQAFQDDLELVRIFKVRCFPSLKTVIVSSTRILKDGTKTGSHYIQKRWTQERRELERAEIFQSGKVELRLVEPGQLIGESSETDFMSTLLWLSPP